MINNDNLIEEIDRSLYIDILNTVEFFIPLVNPAEHASASFTLNHIPHIVFLSNPRSTNTLLENIIHEFHHDKLNLAMQFHEFFDNKNLQYFSPWRDDPRPINGLIHGIYVFLGIYNFYLNALNNESINNAEHKSFIKFRLSDIYHELKLAFYQIQSNNTELTEVGLEFFEQLYLAFQTLPIMDFVLQIPNSISEHLKKWSQNNNYTISVPSEYREILDF